MRKMVGAPRAEPGLIVPFGTEDRECYRCGFPVYLSPHALEMVVPKADDVICIPCIPEVIKENGGADKWERRQFNPEEDWDG